MERIQIGGASKKTRLPDGAEVRGYVLSYLTSGGMSVVYRAEKDGRAFVLKEVPAENSQEVLALTQEKGLLERLSHPGIVKFEKLFEEDGFYYMVLEYVPGQPLSSVIRDKTPPSEAQVVDWGLQLCEVFSYLHRQTPPIIYRDLKPANVLRNGSKLTLIDFGIARLHKGDREHDTSLMGSVHTASPEHYGGTETDERSDIYTLGATLHLLLTQGKAKKHSPFQHPPVRETNPEVSEAMEAILEKALEIQPEDRFQTMEELRTSLTALKQTGELPTRDLSSSGKRNRVPLFALAGLVLALLVGLAFRIPSTAGPSPAPSEVAMEKKADPHQEGSESGPHPLNQSATKIFRAERLDDRWVVTLGEDVPLFSTFDSAGLSAEARSQEIASRFNELYHSRCSMCGDRKLSARDLRIGRYQHEGGHEDTVLFYAHIDDGKVWVGPELLVTISRPEAEKLGTTPRLLAGYWREMARDVLRLSRGEPSEGSPIGQELREELAAIRDSLGPEADIDNLQKLLRELGSEKLLRLRSTVLEIPDKFATPPDLFSPVEHLVPCTS